jgi:hypothetical protein
VFREAAPIPADRSPIVSDDEAMCAVTGNIATHFRGARRCMAQERLRAIG